MCVCVHVSFSASCFVFGVFLVNDEMGFVLVFLFLEWVFEYFWFLGFSYSVFLCLFVCVFCICLCILCVSCVVYACMYLSLFCMYNFISPSLCISVYVCVHVSFLGVFLVDCDLRTFCL